MTTDDKKIIYSMVQVGKVHGTKAVLKDISLSYFYGAKIGVLGHNGSGKSTLLKIMAGVEKEYRGETHISPGYSVGYLEQEPKLETGKTVKEVVSEGLGEVFDLLRQFEEINAKFADEMSPDEMEALIARQAKVQEQLDTLDAWTLDDRLNYAMSALSCPPADSLVDHLSGGERRRVALCRLLLTEPDILLLDEPTNHLDAHSISWLEQHLQHYKGTVIAVTHDRYFLDNVAGWILELDRGQGIPFKGNYTGWLEAKARRYEHEERSQDRRAKYLQKELEWVRMSPKARQSKSKARIQAYNTLQAQESEQAAKELKIYIPHGPRLGDLVIEAEGVCKSYGDRKLFEGLNFKLPAGGIVGIIGPNGAGKTTLFKLITGSEQADAGDFKVGSSVKLGYMEQSRHTLDPAKTLYDVVSGGSDTVTLGKREMNARTYVASFNFSGQDQQKKLEVLSGGERNRVQLALLLKECANVILLDEPTNDLDVETLRALEDGLLNFAGCAVIITHDRWFLDRIATHILAFEGDGHVEWFEGNYSDYEEDYRRRHGSETFLKKKVHYGGIKR